MAEAGEQRRRAAVLTRSSKGASTPAKSSGRMKQHQHRHLGFERHPLRPDLASIPAATFTDSAGVESPNTAPFMSTGAGGEAQICSGRLLEARCCRCRCVCCVWMCRCQSPRDSSWRSCKVRLNEDGALLPQRPVVQLLHQHGPLACFKRDRVQARTATPRLDTPRAATAARRSPHRT